MHTFELAECVRNHSSAESVEVCVMWTRFGFREGFAVDLTTARANGTMWDLSLEDDKAELRRIQNREQPELLLGSSSSDEFSSLLSTRAAREISKLKTEKIEPQIRACVQSYKLQMEMQKLFIHEHPKDSSSWEMPEIQISHQ